MTVPQIIAHRGASAYAPENTLSAFKQAKVLGASMVEFDVMLEASGIPIVIHDFDLKRTTSGKGKVTETNYQKIRELDAGRWFSKRYQGEHIPKLEEVLELLGDIKLNANIEIKSSNQRQSETAQNVLSVINQCWPMHLEEPIISSFDFEVLARIREISPDTRIGLLFDTWQADWLDKVKEFNAVSVHFNHRQLNKKRIEEIKQHDVLLLAYTVNRARRAVKLLGLGVDAIFTDYPDLLI